ncbi:MAG: hypothetical protein A2219_04470 [Elusimicrobia bacterium RIFOXYA2_FULL_50_26]|nr:MAG: hypothetical protein A2219_04470 [Elusimicrobia bacterium RIFOXYA2_FULL_50_26]OGS24630.1 MAG: hypothetical protein A2314_05750 [Elusimicrobia bacterium RIFOXYB2_FULL_50_12]
MTKKVVATIITILLGPGAGHLYLRKFKKGALLIAAGLMIAVHMAIKIAGAIKPADISAESMANIIQEFYRNNPRLILSYDILLAALWSYAIVDILVFMKNNPAANEPEKPA